MLKILDIGPSFQTEILRQTLSKVIIDTLGIEEERSKSHFQCKHFCFDLNDCQYRKKWPKVGKYDLIIMAEIIEHLYTSPKLVLACIKTWLKKDGYLIIQTPNAVSLGKRIKMLIGKHPYEMIRESRINPGHFREYTIKEILVITEKLGFILVNYNICNYFSHPKRFIYNIILLKQFRDGITICFQKTPNALVTKYALK